MSTVLNITGYLHHADKRIMTKEESEIAVAVFQFAAKAGHAYKKLLLESDLYKKQIKFKEGTKMDKVYHIFGELRNAGEFVTREGWKEGLSFGKACKNSRGGHNIKKDIPAEKRELHRKALLLAGGLAEVKGTWAAQTAYLNETEEGKNAVELALKELEAVKEEVKAPKKK